MVKEYGKDKGEEVYFATRNKHKGKDSMLHTAENPLPQSFQLQAPEFVDTLREERKCPVCAEDMDGDKCDVCGYEEAPDGFNNPDLTKAKEIRDQMRQQDSLEIPNEMNPPTPMPGEDPFQQGGPHHGQMPGGPGGSFMQQKTRNLVPTASVTSDMKWEPKLHPKVAGRINKQERPIKPTSQPASNEPAKQAVISDQTKPVTAAMLTAQNLIEAAQRNHTGETMSTRTADGPTPPDASPDTRADVTGTGGVIDSSNEQASKADAQTDVTGIGSTGVTDVEADSTADLPTAGEKSDDAGFNKDKTTDDSGPTKTFGDSDGSQKGVSDAVTNESLEGNQNKDSAAHQSYDSDAFPSEDGGIAGGSANKGVQPVDPIGKAGDRVNVLDSTTTPNNNSGPTKTWSGTDGNGVLRQQDPVTTDSIARGGNDIPNGTNWTSHIISAMKVTDTEIELGLLPKEEKYNRISALQAEDQKVLETMDNDLQRVKTAGMERLAAQHRTAGVKSFPSAFGRRTAAPGVGRYDASTGEFERHQSRTESAGEPEPISQEVMDSGLFSR